MALAVKIIWILNEKSNQKKIADTEPIKHVVKVEKKWSSWLSQIYLQCRIVKFANWVKRQVVNVNGVIQLLVAIFPLLLERTKKQIIVNRKSTKITFD